MSAYGGTTTMKERRTGLGRILDTAYLAGGYFSAACLVAIVILIALKWSARVFGVTFSAGSDFAGYTMAAASFTAFAYTLNNGAHIRVTLGLNALGRFRRVGEIWCFLAGAVLTSWIAREACVFALKSFERGYKAIAPHATPLWIPQALMALGAILLAICFWDNLVRLILRGRSNVVEPELDDAAPLDAEVGR